MSVDNHIIDQSLISDYEPEFLEKITALFLKNARKEMVIISDAIERSDFGEIKHYCHKIKGASLLVGAAGVSTVAKKMELLALEENATVVSEFNHLKSQFAGFEEYSAAQYNID
jgi:HPt (histidine-containing phosphotransfer) domain-containing protein